MPTGTFSLPIVTDVAVDDPWKRAYLNPPAFGEHKLLSFPLKDVRSEIFEQESSDFLSQHGFTAVNYPTRLQNRSDFESLHSLDAVYFTEVKDIIKRVTGATEVFITNSILRRTPENQGKAVLPGGFTKPTPSKSVNPIVSQAGVLLNKGIGPARRPHLDYTPLSARQVTRQWRVDIHDAAKRRGIISLEDDICREEGVSVIESLSDNIIAERYNKSGGRRYAAFSVWRPLVRVERDPLAMLPQKDFVEYCESQDSALELCDYLIRVPGDSTLGGDFLRQLACLKVKPWEQQRIEQTTDHLPWYYISNQTPDEVLLFKFFDSAALGADAKEAGAPIHGSPVLSEETSGAPRESIEVRLMAFW
ncbi:hypothetical protein K461DRAFT_316810 [Myriangium duriaei CBS 260.36]|uniref:Uncharacterized protein n=1 Tax=Myriangium duriaei CBS 260.36 TaxID=1168546 RepID=A0A9P4J9K6_9PEZI|nr:hypothetical protein K461DRAFT_316810 [Myriangium duriaei CBS 260.36]